MKQQINHRGGGHGNRRISRRNALQSLAIATVTGLAGCLAGTGQTRDQGTTQRPTKPVVSFEADVIQSFSETHPAKIRLSFSNETDEMLMYLSQVSPGQRGMFREVWGYERNADAKLLLLRPGDINCRRQHSTPSAIPSTPPDGSTGEGCWRPPCDDLVLYQIMPAWEKFSPNSPKKDEYVLLDGFNSTCLPSGTYDFTAGGRIAFGKLSEDGTPQFESQRYDIERKLSVTIDKKLNVTTSAGVTITSPKTSG